MAPGGGGGGHLVRRAADHRRAHDRCDPGSGVAARESRAAVAGDHAPGPRSLTASIVSQGRRHARFVRRCSRGEACKHRVLWSRKHRYQVGHIRRHCRKLWNRLGQTGQLSVRDQHRDTPALLRAIDQGIASTQAGSREADPANPVTSPACRHREPVCRKNRLDPHLSAFAANQLVMPKHLPRFWSGHPDSRRRGSGPECW